MKGKHFIAGALTVMLLAAAGYGMAGASDIVMAPLPAAEEQGEEPYIFFTDPTYGYSFLYPASYGMIEPVRAEKYVQATSYGFTMKDKKLSVSYGAYFGGTEVMKRSRQTPRMSRLLRKAAGRDWTMAYGEDDYGNVILEKVYYGDRMHQSVVVIYPKAWDGDEAYMAVVDRLVRAFHPSV